MEQDQELMHRLIGWSEQLLLRGTRQLTLNELEALELEAEEAERLQMLFLSELIQQVVSAGRRLLLTDGDEAALLLHCSRLIQYIQLGRQTPSR